jgi:cobalt-zinc-cadmium efflux system membrane fusion protein
MKTANYILLLLILILLPNCNPTEQQASEATQTEADTVVMSDEQLKRISVVTAFPQHRMVYQYVEANGQLDVPPQNRVTISAPLGGFVKRTPLLEGMKVKKGDLLVELEHPDYIQLQKDYLQALAKMEMTQTELNRQQELARENISAQKALEKARTDYQTLRVEVESLRARLAMLQINPDQILQSGIQPVVTLRSPVAGYVSQVLVTTGEYVAAHRELFKIINPEHLHAELFVFEKDLPRISIGQQVTFRLLNDTVSREAHVYLIGKEISAERTIRVHCHLNRDYPDLIPGLYIQARIATGGHMALTVPDEAIVRQGNTAYVFVSPRQNTFVLTPVTTAGHSGGYTELTASSLSNDTPVVIRGAYTLLSVLRNKAED